MAGADPVIPRGAWDQEVTAYCRLLTANFFHRRHGRLPQHRRSAKEEVSGACGREPRSRLFHLAPTLLRGSDCARGLTRCSQAERL